MTLWASWVVGEITILVPETWIFHEEPDPNGMHAIDPPSGPGRLTYMVIAHDRAPAPITEDYAREAAARGIGVFFPVPADRLAIHERAAEHYFAGVEGESGDWYVVAVVHVLAPGRIVSGEYRCLDAQDPYLDDARDILASVEPRA